jgi:hypothetical protein
LKIRRRVFNPADCVSVIDEAISRGNREEWAELREAVLADRALLKKVIQVCRAHVADPRAQRYHFWMHYAEERAAA